MEKNNLDNLFKQKFKDFDAPADPQVWQRIEASLDKKKKKRVVPIWWQLGGVAALLAILLYILNPVADTPVTTPNNPVVDTENVAPNSQQNKKEEIQLTNVDSNDNKDDRPSNLPNGAQQKEENGDGHLSNGIDKNLLPQKQKRLVNQERPNKGYLPKSRTQTDVATKATPKPKQQNQPLNFKSETTEVATTTPDNVEKSLPNAMANKKEEAISAVTGQTDVTHVKDDENPLERSKDSLGSKEKTAIAQQNEKTSIFDAIKEKDKEEEVALLEKESISDKWSMGAAFAPVYYGSVGEGSPIHSNFASNDKSGNVNLSYGLQVSYNLSKKLSLRSGVHRVDFGYDTNEVAFSSSPESSTNALIDNIDYRPTARNLVVRSKPLEAQNPTSTDNEILVANPSRDGRMVQQLGYLEVPFELNYALLDKKLGVNIIGGFSSLFLVDNAVTLQDLQNASAATAMGSANNVNTLNFSTNIGLGIRYRFAPKLQFNLEPIFKYQLNTFSETAGSFNPYSLGVYSGINFRF